MGSNISTIRGKVLPMRLIPLVISNIQFMDESNNSPSAFVKSKERAWGIKFNKLNKIIYPPRVVIPEIEDCIAPSKLREKGSMLSAFLFAVLPHI